MPIMLQGSVVYSAHKQTKIIQEHQNGIAVVIIGFYIMIIPFFFLFGLAYNLLATFYTMTHRDTF